MIWRGMMERVFISTEERKSIRGGNSKSKDIDMGKSRTVWITSQVWFEFNVFEQELGQGLAWGRP